MINSDQYADNGDDECRDIIHQNCDHHHHGIAHDDDHPRNHQFDCPRAGVSNMKGYKKSNQDRCTAFSYLEVTLTLFPDQK